MHEDSDEESQDYSFYKDSDGDAYCPSDFKEWFNRKNSWYKGRLKSYSD